MWWDTVLKKCKSKKSCKTGEIWDKKNKLCRPPSGKPPKKVGENKNKGGRKKKGGKKNNPGNEMPVDTNAAPPSVDAAPPAEIPDTGGWQDAYSTWYTSYARCCPKSPNYDPKADNTECDKYSACKYLGKFAGGHRTYEQVQKENIAAFYSVAGQDGKADKGIGWWNQNAKNKTILLKKPDGTVMEVQALDTCWDGDTKNNDCTKNANKGGGILIDL